MKNKVDFNFNTSFAPFKVPMNNLSYLRIQ